MSDPFNLVRFHLAQEGVFDHAVAELREGTKRSHWMWFVFPQIAGLGSSDMAQAYAIQGLGEAQAYLADTTLGPRLLLCVETILGHPDRTAEQIFGQVDALKLRSSLTLFAQAVSEPSAFDKALDRFFKGEADPLTLQRLL